MALHNTQVTEITIANGASLSDAAHIGVGVVVGISLPTITSAAITFQGSHDGATYRDVYNNDGVTETALTASTGARIVDAPAALVGLPYLKVRSGTTATAVNQLAERTVVIIAK